MNAVLAAGAFVVTDYIVNATVGYKSLTSTSGYITLAELVSFDTGYNIKSTSFPFFVSTYCHVLKRL